MVCYIFQMQLKFVCSVIIFLSKESISLKSMKIRVPEVVKSGDSVTLFCQYDLEEVALYTIKWYWNDIEFFRFVPKESPPFKAFTVQYINVDMSRSNSTEVTLRNVRRELTGDYKCEVSADGPLFHTDIKVSHMTIAELPRGNPLLNIGQTKVEIGKSMKADCYSSGSDPAANLTWYINDKKITDENENVKIFPIRVDSDKALNLHSSKSTIEIITNKMHFVLGQMIIKCEARIFSLWKKEVEEFITENTLQLTSVLDSMTSQNPTNNVILDKIQSEENNGSNKVFKFNLLTVYILILIFVRLLYIIII